MRIAEVARVCAFGALVVLAACGKPADAPDAANAPMRKAGLWELKLTRDGKSGKLGWLKVCLDAATDSRLGVFGRHFAKGDCQRSITRQDDGAYRFSSTCTVGGGAVVATHGVATGDFNTGYTIRSDINVTGAPFEPMNGSHAITIEGRFNGPCPAGLRPGEVSLGTGMKVSIDQLSKLAGAAESGGL